MHQVTVRVGMKVWDDEVEMELALPAAPARLESLLPVFQQVADGLVGLAVERAGAEGRVVSCKKGCGACCRPIVPLSEVEARRIGRLVEELPEPRRTEVRARFDRARERLADPPARFIPWVPLVLAPDWASAHPDASEPRPVEEVLRGVFGKLAGEKGV